MYRTGPLGNSVVVIAMFSADWKVSSLNSSEKGCP